MTCELEVEEVFSMAWLIALVCGSCLVQLNVNMFCMLLCLLEYHLSALGLVTEPPIQRWWRSREDGGTESMLSNDIPMPTL